MQHQPHRQRDWMHRLARLVEERLDVPFVWGPNDCAAFAADAVQAQTGADVLRELRGYRLNQRQALRRERDIGGLPAAIERAGLQPVLPTMAQRGDLVLVQQSPRPVLAVCNGADAIAPGRNGLVHVPLSRAMKAWRV